MPLVVGLTGLASSGKGEVSTYLSTKYDFKKLVFSDVVREEARKRNLLIDTASSEQQKYILSRLGENMRKESGRWDILAEKLVEKIRAQEIERSVVDGFRSVEEVSLFRKNFERFYLVLVNADEGIRFLRRKAEDPVATIENLRKRDNENIEFMGLGKVMKMADFTIYNNEQGVGHLYQKVDELMQRINV